MSEKSYHIPCLEICTPSAPKILGKDFCFRVEEDIKKSRFITSLGHADSKESAKIFIDRIRNEFPDATHNCWAFAVSAPKDTAIIGQSDDGEPHGTAGKPMLNQLLHGEIGECVVVVTRYFGGIKLGTGGLIRAYQSGVAKALEKVDHHEKIVYCNCTIECDYEHINKIHHIAPKFNASISNENFAERIQYTFYLPETELENFKQALVNNSNGRISF